MEIVAEPLQHAIGEPGLAKLPVDLEHDILGEIGLGQQRRRRDLGLPVDERDEAGGRGVGVLHEQRLAAEPHHLLHLRAQARVAGDDRFRPVGRPDEQIEVGADPLRPPDRRADRVEGDDLAVLAVPLPGLRVGETAVLPAAAVEIGGVLRPGEQGAGGTRGCRDSLHAADRRKRLLGEPPRITEAMHPQPRLGGIDGHDRRHGLRPLAHEHPTPAPAGRGRQRQGVLPPHVGRLSCGELVAAQHALVGSAEEIDVGGRPGPSPDLEPLDGLVVDRLRGQERAVVAARMPADHLPGHARPFHQVVVAVAVEIREVPVDPAAAFAGRQPHRPPTADERQLLDALFAAHEELVPSGGEVAHEQAPRLARRRSGQQVPLARLLPGRLGIDRGVGGLRVDRDPIRRRGEHQQLGPAVGVDVVGHGIHRHLVDRHLAVGPVRRQRKLVGSVRIAGGVARPFGGGQPAVEVETGLAGIDDHHVVPPVATEVGHDQAFGPPVERNHADALPAVEGPGRLRGGGSPRPRERPQHDRGPRQSPAGRAAGRDGCRVHPAKDTPGPRPPPRSRRPLTRAPARSPRRPRPHGASRGPWPRSGGRAPW